MVDFYRAAVSTPTLDSLSKPRRQQERERHQTKGLTSRTMARCICVVNIYTFLRSYAKQREMT